jgi:hypothetical protein
VADAIQHIDSGGVWGIESDSDEAYLRAEARGQYDKLRDVLALPRHIFHGAGPRNRIIPRQAVQSRGATRRWTTSRRIAGSVGRCVVSLRRGFVFGEPQRLEEREGDHREERMVVKAPP